MYWFFGGFIACLIPCISIYIFFIIPKFNYLANTDRQTGLLNVQYLLRILKKIKQETVIIIIDIDDFKRFNSDYSYQKGDEVILSLRDALKKVVKTCDGRIFRYRNGDEFIILLKTGGIDVQDLKMLFAKINAELNVTGRIHPVTLSYGVTTVRSGTSIEYVIQRLESALLVAKYIKDAAYYECDRKKYWIHNNSTNAI